MLSPTLLPPPFQTIDTNTYLPPTTSTSRTQDKYGWHLFSTSKPTLVDVHGSSVNHVHSKFISSTNQGICVASTGGKVQLYSFDKNKREDFTKTKTFAKIKTDAYSARIRNDGKLVALGTQSGSVVIFDTSTRAMMRTFTDHTNSCRVVRWSRDGTRVITGSSDKTSRMFDLHHETAVNVCKGYHTDDIRAVAPLYEHNGSELVWVTGCYDHMIRIWDARTSNSNSSSSTNNGQIVSQVDHGAPVEDLCTLSNNGNLETLLVSVGGIHTRMWDVRALRNPITSVSHHAKTITGVITSLHDSFVLTCSLDGTVRVMSPWEELKLIQTLKFKGQLLSLTLSEDDWRIMVGSAQGEFVARTRRGDPPSSSSGEQLVGGRFTTANTSTNNNNIPRSSTRQFFNRGQSTSLASIQNDGMVVTSIIGNTTSSNTTTTTNNNNTNEAKVKRRKLRPHDMFLKKFSYKEALDAALETREPSTVAAVFEELCQRGNDAIDIALSGRDETDLEPILAYITRFIAHPRFSHLLIPICDKILSMYEVGTNVVIDQSAGKLLTQVTQEVDVQKGLMTVLGGLDLVKKE
jgi:U3 small nucleolar RNA-associated protein 15